MVISRTFSIALTFIAFAVASCAKNSGQEGTQIPSFLDLPPAEAEAHLDHVVESGNTNYLAEQWMLAKAMDRQELVQNDNKLQSVVRLGEELQLQRPEYRADFMRLVELLVASKHPLRREFAALALDSVPGDEALDYLWMLSSDEDSRVVAAALQSLEVKIRLQGVESNPTPQSDIAIIKERIGEVCGHPDLSERNQGTCLRISSSIRN